MNTRTLFSNHHPDDKEIYPDPKLLFSNEICPRFAVNDMKGAMGFSETCKGFYSLFKPHLDKAKEEAAHLLKVLKQKAMPSAQPGQALMKDINPLRRSID